MFWHVCSACNGDEKACTDVFYCIVMVDLSSLEDIHSHTKHTEEILTGINPQAVN